MGINFKVSMVLDAVNHMGPGVRKAMDTVERLKQKATATARETAKLNPVASWSDKIAQASQRLEEFGKKAEGIRKQAEKLMTSGMKDVAMGGSIAMPILATVKPAADLQTKFTTMQVMGLADEGKNIIRRQSMDLAKNLAFDLSQVVGVAQALQKAGMNEAKIIQAQRAATSYAQLEYNRYGSDPNQTATHLAHIAESAGVLYASKQERETHGLKTQSDVDNYIVGKFERMAETLNRVVAVTSSDTATLAESIKYSMPTAKSLGWNEESAMLMSGIYSRFGIEGSMSGTHLKDFAARLNPYQHYVDEDAGAVNKRLTAMQAAGWLDGAQWVTTKAGKKKFYSVGQSAFHEKDGTLKKPEEIFSKIYEAYERFNAHGERLQFEGILHDVLGEQGKDIAQLLNQNPEMFQHIKEDMGRVLSMEKSLEKYQNNVNTQWDIFAGNISTARTQLGDLLLEDIGGKLKGWNEKLFGQTGKVSPLAQWIEDHKELITWVLKSAFGFAALTTGVGVLKIAAAGMKFVFAAPFMTGIGWLGKFGTRMSGLYDSFKYFRRLGGGVFESIWKGAQFAYPWLGKLVRTAGRVGASFRGAAAGFKYFRSAGSGVFTSILKGAELVWPCLGKLRVGMRAFTAFFLRNAARIGAGWLVAMGPAGWIILGVTALISGAVLAWTTNFMGFRDKCKAVWGWIKDYIDFILPGLGKKIDGFIAGASAKWEDFKKAVGDTWDAVSKITKETVDAMCTAVSEGCKRMGIDFDGLADKAKGFLQETWESQPGMQAYKAIEKHFNDFEVFRAQKHPTEGFRAIRGEGISYTDAQKPKLMPLSFAPKIIDTQRSKVIPITFLQEKRANAFMPSQPRGDMQTQIYQLQPYIVQPAQQGNQAQSFRQTNNIKVESHQEAAEFVKQAVPDKYKSAGNNPRNRAELPYEAVGAAV